jgi:hypothetical protein
LALLKRRKSHKVGKKENNMTTVNIKFRNPVAWLTKICCLVFLFILTGCDSGAIQLANGLEEHALKNGTISVGAVRVTDYNDPCLAESRQRLINALSVMEANLTDANIMPQSYMSNESLFKLGLTFSWIKGGGGPNSVPFLSPKDLNDLSQTVINGQPKPTEIEMVGLRMATRKFIESEMEDLNLISANHAVEPNYRRFVISLDCTAWVTGEAKAALVYIDLYPHKADIWGHEAGDVLALMGNQTKKNPITKFFGNLMIWFFPNSQTHPFYSREEIKWGEPNISNWNKTLKILEDGFSSGSLKNIDRPKMYKEVPCDCIAKCHDWLAEYKLCPRIVQVERMEEGEYLISAQEAYSGYGLQGEVVLPSGVSAGIQAEADKKKTSNSATVLPSNLAFVAGSSRAGWLFRPSPREGNSMLPKERRLRIVVDIPKDMTKVGIYVHKLFLDSDLHVIPSADLLNQMGCSWLNQGALVWTDSLYEPMMRTDPALYGLMKTRIRNMLYQGWSEEIVADIPQNQKQ